MPLCAGFTLKQRECQRLVRIAGNYCYLHHQQLALAPAPAIAIAPAIAPAPVLAPVFPPPAIVAAAIASPLLFHAHEAGETVVDLQVYAKSPLSNFSLNYHIAQAGFRGVDTQFISASINSLVSLSYQMMALYGVEQEEQCTSQHLRQHPIYVADPTRAAHTMVARYDALGEHQLGLSARRFACQDQEMVYREHVVCDWSVSSDPQYSPELRLLRDHYSNITYTSLKQFYATLPLPPSRIKRIFESIVDVHGHQLQLPTHYTHHLNTFFDASVSVVIASGLDYMRRAPRYHNFYCKHVRRAIERIDEAEVEADDAGVRHISRIPRHEMQRLARNNSSIRVCASCKQIQRRFDLRMEHELEQHMANWL